jgi:hypothetical protein
MLMARGAGEWMGSVAHAVIPRFAEATWTKSGGLPLQED